MQTTKQKFVDIKVFSLYLVYSNFERKNYKALTFSIVHFTNFEISTSF